MINRENFEEIMFMMSEGHYPAAEMEELLRAIGRDAFLSNEWEKWRLLRLSDPVESYADEAGHWADQFIQSRKQRTIRPVWYRTLGAVAAATLLVLVCVKKVDDIIIPAGPASGDRNIAVQDTGTEKNAGWGKAAPVQVLETGRITKSAAVPAALTDQNPVPNITGYDSLSSVFVAVPLVPSMAATEPFAEASVSEGATSAEAYSVCILTTPFDGGEQPAASSRRNTQETIRLGDLLTNSRVRLHLDTRGRRPRILVQGINETDYSINLQNNE